MNRQLKYFEAIREATDQAMAADPAVYIMGLGVPDPKGIFGTTLGLKEKYGSARVMDMPTSENAMTGIAIGSAIRGMRPIMTHQRVDFFFLALDQLINNAAKWRFMFADQMKAPIVIRLIMGRGWGQGPQHSQSLHSMLAHIPGLTVVMPSNPYDAKGLLLSAVQSLDPVVYFEHRWLHGVHGDVPQNPYTVPFGKARVVQEGKDVTVVALSHMTLEAFRAAKQLDGENISVEVIDVRSLKPLDTETILTSVRKTGRLVVADPDTKSVGFAAEILAQVAEAAWDDLKCAPLRITYPDAPTPTSWPLSNAYYPTSEHIAEAILRQVGRPARPIIVPTRPMDAPDPTFTGPF
ncbi:MAG: hypothetical protein RL235_192 [Chlamydiota bacterium]|jgi:pyruvate dehydrogenase E1 component beta subunit